jgi:hypothetical protein
MTNKKPGGKAAVLAAKVYNKEQKAKARANRERKAKASG